jgi:hypothetical protein
MSNDKMTTNEEQDRMWKETAVDYFKRLGKTIKILVRRASSSANI